MKKIYPLMQEKVVIKHITTIEQAQIAEKYLLVIIFHPELTDELRFHEYFMQLTKRK